MRANLVFQSVFYGYLVNCGYLHGSVVLTSRIVVFRVIL